MYLYTHVVVKTSNLVISRRCFADDGKEMDKREKLTCTACKAIVFAHLINMQICDVFVAVAVVGTTSTKTSPQYVTLHYRNSMSYNVGKVS